MQENEKEKKSETESLKLKSNTSSPKQDINNDNSGNVPSVYVDVEVGNIPSSNNSPSKHKNPKQMTILMT